MSAQSGILIGKGEDNIYLNPRFANRHGLIAGATGTGKTISLQVLAEGFSRIGVPVFMADIKGDLTGIAAAGNPHPKIDERVQTIGIDDFRFEGCPTVIRDLSGELATWHAPPCPTWPLLLVRLLDLNNTQEGVLNIAFKVADDQGMLLLDLKDLRAMLQFLGKTAKQFSNTYWQCQFRSIGCHPARALLVLEQQGRPVLWRTGTDLVGFHAHRYGRLWACQHPRR
ncbi:MAG: helicase HerA-like domain-containing protein [Thiothrix sp.]